MHDGKRMPSSSLATVMTLSPMKRHSVFWDSVLHGSTAKENAFKQLECREVCLSNVKYLQTFTCSCCVCDCDESPVGQVWMNHLQTWMVFVWNNSGFSKLSFNFVFWNYVQVCASAKKQKKNIVYVLYCTTVQNK